MSSICRARAVGCIRSHIIGCAGSEACDAAGEAARTAAVAGVLSADCGAARSSIAETAARNATITTYRRIHGYRITGYIGHIACCYCGSGDVFRKIYLDGFIVKQLS